MGCGEWVKSHGIKYKYIVTEQPGDVKYSIGNEVAKELTHMSYGHGQWCRDGLREWGVLDGGGQREKNQSNCSSIINKI